MQRPLPEVLPITPFTRPASAIVGVPGSKSITNRALALGVLGRDGITLFYGLISRDTEIMRDSLTALGRTFGKRNDENRQDGTSDEDYRTLVNSGDWLELQKSSDGSLFPNHNYPVKLYVGNAGTAARFLTALLCLQKDGEFFVDGDEAMYRRPMKGLTDALSSLGADFTFHQKEGCIPFTVKTHGIKGGNVQVDASESSQILSALLIMAAGLNRPFAVELTGKTVSEPFVMMTIEMLRQFNVKVAIIGNRFVVNGLANYPYVPYCVEPDATAASYFMALPIAMTGDSTVFGLARCKLQGDMAFLHVLKRIGIQLDIIEEQTFGGREKINVRSSIGSAAIRGVTADFNAFSDTFLTLAAVSPLLTGTTRIEGIAHTRKQETDRVHAAFIELHDKLGQEVREEPDALEIHPNPEALKKLAQAARDRKKATGEGTGCIEIDTYNDHRFAMSFAILGCRDLLGDGKPWLAIKDPGCCKKTFPDFFDVLEKARTDSNEA